MQRFAAFSAQLRASSLPALFALSVAAYLALVTLPSGGQTAVFCGSFGFSQLWWLIQNAPWLLSPGKLALDWGLMVIAMMTPLIAPLLAYVRRSVSGEFRQGAVAAFLLAYWATWCASFVILFPLALGLLTLVGDQVDLPVALAIALVYSASPLAQRARNACHLALRIAPFGARAWLDSAWQGGVTGVRCMAACWPWMLVPITLVTGHTVLMIVVGIYLFAERIAPPARPVWQTPPALETVFGPLVRH